MGYVGPGAVRRLRAAYPSATLVGFDMGYFAHCLTNAPVLPETCVDAQYFGDVRRPPGHLLTDVDAVVHLAAISNDPMGNAYESTTLDINYRASVELAKKARAAGAKAFVFASSCSVYGCAEDGARTEQSEVNPLTAYAKSKVFTEKALAELADRNFRVTCLRFATACGMSDRLRLDLVLNDFVAAAISTGKITVLSDGTPWRPLINVQDMARALEWAVGREREAGGDCLVVNAGSEEWNYQIRELAEAAARIIPGVEVHINPNGQPDKRSYRVDFSLFKRLAPRHHPQFDLLQTVVDLRQGLKALKFSNPDFRNSSFMRLRVLAELRQRGLLTDQLEWTGREAEPEPASQPLAPAQEKVAAVPSVQ
jgi:nucleoside-diphosphate-sugar epimerase